MLSELKKCVYIFDTQLSAFHCFYTIFQQAIQQVSNLINLRIEEANKSLSVYMCVIFKINNPFLYFR